MNTPQDETNDRITQSLKPHETYVLHNTLLGRPDAVVSALGSYITLASGHRILDACTGAAVAIIGHGHPEVQTYVMKQMTKVCYTHTVAFTTPSAEILAQNLLAGEPHGLSRAFFVCSGSEATDSALKLARCYHLENGQPERKHIVARRQSYHGNTIGAMSVGSHVARKAPYKDSLVLHNVSYVSPTYAYRGQLDGETEEEYGARLVQELDDEFKAVGPHTVMAFISEPVGGATAGCLTAPKGYYQGVRRLCDQYGILLILDEIMCGTGRTGTYFAFEQEGEGVYPDLITLGKGLGGGYVPIAAVVAHQKVIRAFQKGSGLFGHSFTYQAHALCCAAALAVQEVLRRDDLVSRAALKGEWLENALRSVMSKKKYVGNIRGRGLFWGIEFVRDQKTKEPFQPEVRFTHRMVDEAKRRGLSIYPGAGTADGVRGDHVLLAPAFNASDVEFDLMMKLLEGTYDAVEKDIDCTSATIET